MPRGRPAKPAEIKQLLGNPGKRRLALSNERGHGTALPKPQAPSYLTQEVERQAFAYVMEHLPPNLVRHTDVDALARWAAWLCIWVKCKTALDGRHHWYTTKSDHSGELHREHPISKRMDKAEAHLVTLEDRLCLNIVARNNVMHRLFNMPSAHPGAGLFETTDDEKAADKDAPPPENADLDPLGFLDRAGKQHLQ